MAGNKEKKDFRKFEIFTVDQNYDFLANNFFSSKTVNFWCFWSESISFLYHTLWICSQNLNLICGIWKRPYFLKNTLKNLIMFWTFSTKFLLFYAKFGWKTTKIYIFWRKKYLAKKIKIMAHSKNLKSAKIYLLLYFQPLWAKSIPKLWDFFLLKFIVLLWNARKICTMGRFIKKCCTEYFLI